MLIILNNKLRSRLHLFGRVSVKKKEKKKPFSRLHLK